MRGLSLAERPKRQAAVDRSRCSRPTEERGVEPLIRDLIGARCDDVIELLDRFEAFHLRGEPHYYLSLLGTHPAALPASRC